MTGYADHAEEYIALHCITLHTMTYHDIPFHSIPLQVLVTGYAGHAEEYARTVPLLDAFVAIGGDGTVRREGPRPPRLPGVQCGLPS